MARKASRKHVEAPASPAEAPENAPKRRGRRPASAAGEAKRGYVFMLRLSKVETTILDAIATEAELDKTAVLRRLLLEHGWRLTR